MAHVRAMAAATANSVTGIAHSNLKRRPNPRQRDEEGGSCIFGHLFTREKINREFHHKRVRCASAPLGAAKYASAVQPPMGGGA